MNHWRMPRVGAALFGFGLSFSILAAPQTLTVSGATVSAQSTATTLDFPLARGGETATDTWVQYHTVDGSAVSGTDYTGGSGLFKLATGLGSGAISVPVLPDRGTGGDRTLQLVLDGVAATGPATSFAGHRDFGVGHFPIAMVSADFNGDGRPDYAVANREGHTISVALNTTAPGATTPSFSAAPEYATGNRPMGIATADFNGDGKPDLVVVNQFENSASVYFNTTAPGATAPSFAARQDFGTASFPMGVSAGDLNGDGKPDLVVVFQGGNVISVLLNTTAPGAATASFAAPQSFPIDNLGQGPIAIADFNGDGKPDLAAAISNDRMVSVLLNTTAPGATVPSFAPQQSFSVGQIPVAVTATDVNGDGRPDLVVSNQLSNNVGVLLNTTAPGATVPSFAAQKTFAVTGNVSAVAAGDLNGDGRPDLLVANGSVAVSVLLNVTATGAAVPAFAPQQVLPSGSSPFGTAIADVNGDGRPDLLAASFGDWTVSVLLNVTATGAAVPAFAPQQVLPSGSSPFGTAIADVNGDGRPDLLAASFGDWTVSVLLNTTPAPTASPGFAAQKAFGTSAPTAVTAADLNGDGQPDLVAANVNDATVSVLLSTTAPGAGTPAFSAAQTFPTQNNPLSVTVADIDGDGLPDLLVGNQGSSSVSVLLNTTMTGATAPSFAPQQAFAAGSTPCSIRAADLNGDGRLDLVVVNNLSDTVSVLLNTAAPGAAPAFAAPQAFATGASPTTVSVADLNGDGLPDLAVANNSDNSVSVLFNTTAPGDTTPSFAAKQDFATAGFPYAIATADLNGDGRPDLVATSEASNVVSVLLNTTATGDTTPSFAARQDFATGGDPVSIYVLDVDGDGRPDLVVANKNDNTLSLLRNTTSAGASTPAFATQQTLSVGTIPSGVAAADLNGDGRPDLLAADFGTGQVSVLLNNQYQANASGSPATGTIHSTDLTPDPFSFPAVKNATPNTVYITDPVTISGLDGPTPISFKGTGAYSIDGGVYTTAAGTIGNGQQVRIQLTSSASARTSVHGGIVVGKGSAPFIVTTAAADTTPDAFSFTSVRNAAVSTLVTSNAVAITGIDAPAPVQVSNASYRIGGGGFTTAPGTISAGQTLELQLTSSPTAATSVHASVKVGNVAAAFTVTTAKAAVTPPDTTPDAFSFTPVKNAAVSTPVISNAVTIMGIDSAAPIRVSNANYRIDGGNFTTAPGTISAGQTVELQVTSSAAPGTAVHGGLTVGGVSAAFVVTTAK